MPIERKKRDVKERFLEKVLQVESGCKEFQRDIDRLGYGKFWYKGRKHVAHRISWLLFVGPIPEDLLVLHKCDNRRCVNIEHLYIGTHRDNVMDKVERCKWWGRMKIPKTTVDEAVRLYNETGMSQQAIADHLGIKQVQVSRYIRKVQRKNY